MKYKLEVYGWSVESTAHSLNDKQLENIEILMKDNEYKELWESKSEMEDIVGDIWSPDLFHMNAPLDNGGLFFKVKDEDDNLVLEFEEGDLGDHYENVGDVDTLFDYESYYASPDYRNDNIKHIMFIAEENKGGIYEMLLNSDKEPTPEDFSIMGGGIDTPEGEWDFISRIFFKDKVLDINDWLDSSGKSCTMEIYTQDGRVIK